MRQVPYDSLTRESKELLQAAEKVMETAYNPYSHFYVGAAIRSNNGKIIAASNIENAAYGSTICAERNAIGKANSEGIRNYKSIALIARGENFDTAEVTAPCGSCRQTLFEVSQLSSKPLELIMSTTKKDKIILATIEELLPLGFGPRDLGVDVKKYQD